MSSKLMWTPEERELVYNYMQIYEKRNPKITTLNSKSDFEFFMSGLPPSRKRKMVGGNRGSLIKNYNKWLLNGSKPVVTKKVTTPLNTTQTSPDILNAISVMLDKKLAPIMKLLIPLTVTKTTLDLPSEAIEKERKEHTRPIAIKSGGDIIE